VITSRRRHFEALIEKIEIESDEPLTPHFRIPIMRDGQGLAPTDQPHIRREPKRFAHCHLGGADGTRTRDRAIMSRLL
jgi:hypothetical protein